jgi:putative FmdB family regulatory protein
MGELQKKNFVLCPLCFVLCLVNRLPKRPLTGQPERTKHKVQRTIRVLVQFGVIATDCLAPDLARIIQNMPIYEYQCKKCKAHTEAFQKITDKPLTKCKKCGGRLEKVISAPAIQFKGSGWYVTDYSGKATKGEKSESETTEKKSDTKTKESSPAKSTSEKASPPKASGD